MTGGRTDASTSTDDVKGGPLCLFYFTHPFGVLSPEPPTVTTLTAAPPVARAFLNMQPVSCFRSPSSPSPSCLSPSDDYDTTWTSSSQPSRPARPVRLVRNYPLDPGGDSLSLSSSLLSGDTWLDGGGGSGGGRVVPYSRTLPPLRLPAPRELAWDSSDDVWPARGAPRERFSLPPIELPVECGPCRGPAPPARHRRARLSGLQRMLTCLMKRRVNVFIAELRSGSAARRDAMGYVFDNCPTVHECCWGVPLRAGVCCIAAAGLAWGALYCWPLTAAGARAAERAGLPAGAAAGARYVLGALGVLLLAVHALLAAAARYESDALCEVYLWFAVLHGAASLASALALGALAAAAGGLAFAAGYAALMLAALLLTAYFSVVVANYRMTLP